ncbi:MAG: nickel-dependent lactate racemase [Lachnospiraceae bacterium]
MIAELESMLEMAGCRVFTARCRAASPENASKDEDSCIETALSYPVGTKDLAVLSQGKHSACVIVDDATRKTPADRILPRVLSRLHAGGIMDADIRIVFALGSHRAMTRNEMIQKVGPEVFSRIRCENSSFWDPAGLVSVGTTSMGADIQVTRSVYEADLRIGIGSIVPHTCMGWSGGAKILFPGVTGPSVVSAFHAMEGLETDFLFGEENAKPRLAVEEWTKKIGLDYIVNCVLRPDGSLADAVSGDYIAAHRAGCKMAKAVYGVKVPFAPDLAIIDAAPLSTDFWQCSKALESGARVTRRGGSLFLVCSCPEGVGPHPDLGVRIDNPQGREEILAMLSRREYGEALLAQSVATSIRKCTQAFSVHVFSDGLWEKKFTSRSMAVDPDCRLREVTMDFVTSFVQTKGRTPGVLLIPCGGETVPDL